jgi:fatty-acyl-CoA synthase
MRDAAYDWIAFNARRRPDHLCAVDLPSGRRFTWGQFEARSRRVAAALTALGVRRGDRIAVLARNSTDQLDLWFAAMKTGHIFAPVNWRLAVPEIAPILEDSQPKLLFHGAEFVDAARAATRGMAVTLVNLGDGAAVSDYEALVAAAGDPPPRPDQTIDDPWVLLYTSGTTGRSKGVIVTQRMTLANIHSMAMFARVTSDVRTLVFNPMFHTGGLNAYASSAMNMGGVAVVMRQFDVPAILRHIGDPALGITHINGAVTMYLMLSQHPDFAAADFSRIVCATIGGENVPPAILALYREKGVTLQQNYGLTEAGPVLAAVDRDMMDRKFGSVGTQLLYTEMTLRSREGRPVPPGEIGEIWCRGPNVTPGYWNNPEKTQEAFTDGWLRTGDAAWLDEDGYYWLVDRWKDMYISGAENVYPAEVESVLYKLPQIAECAVIGVPHPKWGETGRAIVVLKPGEALTEAQIIAHCRAHLAGFKVPQSIVYTDVLPRSGGGKVQKPELRKRFGEPVKA